MPHQMPFYTVEHRERTKIILLMRHQLPELMAHQMKTFWGNFLVVVVFGPFLTLFGGSLRPIEDTFSPQTFNNA